MIATTINMNENTKAVLSRAAVQLNTTRRSIVVRLLMRMMRDSDKHRGGFEAIGYQSRDAGGEWHCFSIRFRQDEYEFFTDLRKVCKCSVSLLVAMAVEKYLDEMLSSFNKNVYKNVHFENYIMHNRLIGGVLCWMFCWGIPENMENVQLE